MEPCEFTQITAKGIHIFKEEKSLDTFIQELKDEYKKLELIKPRVIDNFDELQKELEETEKDIEQFEEESHNLRIQLSKENTAIAFYVSTADMPTNAVLEYNPLQMDCEYHPFDYTNHHIFLLQAPIYHSLEQVLLLKIFSSNSPLKTT